MNDMIEKLKDKNYVRAFGLMSEPERECLKKVGKENCLCFHGGQWGDPYRSNACFNYQFTYAIKPEPEFVDLEIKREVIMQIGDKKFLVLGCIYNNEYVPLHCLTSLPNFELFWYEDTNTIRIDLDEVAHRIHEGKTVYARVRKA